MTNFKQFLASKYVEYAMLLCVFAYCLFKIADRKIGEVFLAFILLGTICAFIVHRKRFLKDKILWLFLAAIIIQILAWLNGVYFSPYSPSRLNLSPLASLFYFIPIAYWLKGNPRYVLATLTVFCVSSIFACIMHSVNPLNEFSGGLKGYRVDFNITNANHTAAFAGMASIVATFLLYIYLNFRQKIQQQWFKWLAPTVLVVLLLINLLLVYMTFSRATWLALSLVILITPFIFIKISNNLKQKKIKLIFILSACFLLIFTTTQIPHISYRLQEENNIIQELANKPIDSIGDSSIGLRVKFWYSSMPWIKDYPLLGLGDINAREFVIQQSPYLNQQVKDEYSHLHNGHLEIIVAYGIPALLITWGIFAYIFKTALSLKLSYKGYIIYGIIAFTLYYFTINLFESFFIFKVGQLMQSIILACIYTFYMKQHFDEH